VDDFRDIVGILLVVFIGAALFVGLIGLAMGSVEYFGSCKKADLINSEFGTEYTCSEIFWAGATVEDVIKGKKHRLDINVN
jgi:hypothetical protein